MQCRGNNSSGACHCRMYSADSSEDCEVSDLHSDQRKYGAGKLRKLPWKSHFECADAWRNTGGGCYCSGKNRSGEYDFAGAGVTCDCRKTEREFKGAIRFKTGENALIKSIFTCFFGVYLCGVAVGDR